MELKSKMKYSKDLLELRFKERKLVKSKNYEEAEKVKAKADLLEEFEKKKLESDVCQILTIIRWLQSLKRKKRN
jgi:hypothetical protein